VKLNFRLHGGNIHRVIWNNGDLPTVFWAVWFSHACSHPDRSKHLPRQTSDSRDPCFVSTILGALSGGDVIDILLEDYPNITREDIEAALEFASRLSDYQESAYGAVA
jgi:hypothetical protein